MDTTLRDDLLPIVVQAIIGHVTIYQAECAYWSHCVKEGRLTVREEAQLRANGRYRLENYILRKLLEQREH